MNLIQPTVQEYISFGQIGNYHDIRLFNNDKNALVADKTNKLVHNIDISDVTNFVYLNSVPCDNAHYNNVYDGYSYVGGEGIVIIIDLSNPAEISIIGTATDVRFRNVQETAFYNNWAYAMSRGENKLIPINVTDKTNPVVGTPIGSIGAPYYTQSIAHFTNITDDIIVTSSYRDDHLACWQLDGDNVTLLSVIPTVKDTPHELRYYNGFVYVAAVAEALNFDGGIEVYDYRNPSNPSYVKSYNATFTDQFFRTHGLWIDRQFRLYHGGLYYINVYSLKNPANPEYLYTWEGQFVDDAENFDDSDKYLFYANQGKFDQGALAAFDKENITASSGNALMFY